MEVLLWLAPAVVVTTVAMAWVAWVGRERRAEVDRDVAVRRMGEALERGRRSPGPGYAVRRAPRERSTGVAVRRARPPSVHPVVPTAEPAPEPAAEPALRPGEAPERRAS